MGPKNTVTVWFRMTVTIMGTGMAWQRITIEHHFLKPRRPPHTTRHLSSWNEVLCFSGRRWRICKSNYFSLKIICFFIPTIKYWHHTSVLKPGDLFNLNAQYSLNGLPPRVRRPELRAVRPGHERCAGKETIYFLRKKTRRLSTGGLWLLLRGIGQLFNHRRHHRCHRHHYHLQTLQTNSRYSRQFARNYGCRLDPDHSHSSL